MEPEQALAELLELSSQVQAAVVLRADGSVLAATEDGPAADALAQSALELVAAAFELRSTPDEVTRVEVELAEGGVYVLRDGGRTIAARTAPGATPGLVVYDLRTCLHAIDQSAARRQRRPKEAPAAAPSDEPEQDA